MFLLSCVFVRALPARRSHFRRSAFFGRSVGAALRAAFGAGQPCAAIRTQGGRHGTAKPGPPGQGGETWNPGVRHGIRGVRHGIAKPGPENQKHDSLMEPQGLTNVIKTVVFAKTIYFCMFLHICPDRGQQGWG